MVSFAVSILVSERSGKYPNSACDGATLVVAFGQLLWTTVAIVSHLSQSSCVFAAKSRRYCSIHWFFRSVSPSVWGWYAVLRFLCAWIALTNSVANDDVKRGSLSEMIRLGNPNHRYTLSKYNWAISAPVIVVLHGRKSAALVHPWSTIVRIASYPLLGGSCVIRSMATTSNGTAVIGTGIRYSGVAFFGRFLFCWQTAHPSTYLRIHVSIPTQLWCRLTSVIVLSRPGCPAVGSS